MNTIFCIYLDSISFIKYHTKALYSVQTTDYSMIQGVDNTTTLSDCVCRLSPVVCMSCVNLEPVCIPGMGKISALKTEEFGIVRMTLKLGKHNQPCFFLFCESKVDVVKLK